jgi:hydroxymethylbilane synthase
MAPPTLKIGTRGSDLALWQANTVKTVLSDEIGRRIEIKIIKTEGDRIDDLSFDKMEGKGFFTKELEQALLDGSIDVAVHSLKDLPTSQPDGLRLGAVGFRADRRELLLINPDAVAGDGLIPVKAGGTVGTSSARRQAQIAYHNSQVEIKDLRGNVPTRIGKLCEGQYDAIVIAAAGVERLGLNITDLEARYLDPEQFLPAPAQGVLGIQVRDDDPDTLAEVALLGNRRVETEVALERGLLARFDAGCSLPLGVFSEVDDSRMRLVAVLGSRTGDGWGGIKRAEVTGDNIDEIITEAYQSLAGE